MGANCEKMKLVSDLRVSSLEGRVRNGGNAGVVSTTSSRFDIRINYARKGISGANSTEPIVQHCAEPPTSWVGRPPALIQLVQHPSPKLSEKVGSPVFGGPIRVGEVQVGLGAP